jgi:DNA-binding MarR family transcriptional regulator
VLSDTSVSREYCEIRRDHPSEASSDWADFSFVRDRLGLSDSALSKQFSVLEDAGYVTIERLVTNRRRRVRVSLTDVGRKAFEGHVAALQQVIATADAVHH